MKKIFNTLLLFICISCLPAFGQVTFSALNADVCDIDGTATVDFTINTAETLGAFQFAVIWDTDILENAVLEDVALGSSYNEDEIDEGEIRVGWFNVGGNGDFDPDQVLFRITFDHVSASANSALVDITALLGPDGYPVIVADDNFGAISDSDIIINDGIITYGDAVSPIINNCPANITQIVPFGQMTDVVNWPDIMPTDNCSTPSLTESHSSGDVFSIETTEVSITAMDAAGNVSIACEFTVTVSEEVDETPFTINISEEETGCENLNVSFDFTTANFTNMTSMAYAVTWDASLLEYIDATNVFSPVNNFNNSASGELRVGWFEGNGLSLDDNDLLYTLNFNFLGNAGDVASLQIVALPDYQIIVSDDNGQLNASQYEFNSSTVTHINTPPVINDCPTAMTIDAMGDCSDVINFTLPTITENCDANISLIQTSLLGNGDIFPIGESTVTYEVSDNLGQTATCSFTITIEGQNNITMGACPADQTVAANSGECTTAAVTWTPPTATNTCNGEPTLLSNYNPGDDFPVGSTVVNYNASNDSGNTAMCSFNVVVTADDTEAPVVVCPADIEINLPIGEMETTVSWEAATAIDNCSSNLIPVTNSMSGDTYAIGVYTVSYAVSDETGNEGSCTFNITIQEGTDCDNDTEAPMIANCPSDMMLTTDDLTCTTTVNWTAPTITDNCDFTFVVSHENGTTYDSGIYPVTYNVIDASGNTSTCEFTFTISDIQSPILFGLPNADIVVANDPGECGAIVTWDAPAYFDNCEIVSFNCTRNSGEFFGLGTVTVNCTVSDAAGNMTTESFSVTVKDEEAPIFQCVADIIINADGTVVNDPDNILIDLTNVGCNMVEIDFALPTATDACSFASIEQTAGELDSGDVFAVGSYSLEYTATDLKQNTTSCSFDITVQGEAVPEVVTTFTDGLCEGGSGEICVSGLEGATIIAWFDSEGNNVSNTECLNLEDVEINDTDTYSINIQTGTNCIHSLTYEFVVFEAPELSVNVAPVLCATGNENLEFTVTDLANSNVTDWFWTGAFDSTSTIRDLVIGNVDESNAGTYNLTATNANGCVSQIAVEAIVTTSPEAAQITATNQVICTGESTVLIGTNYGTDNVTYIWTAQPAAGAGLPSNTNSFQIEVAPTSGANVTYFMNATIEGCSVQNGSISIIQEGAPAIDIVATGNTVCVDGTTSLVLSEMGGQAVAWNWTGPNGFMAQGQEIIIDNLTAESAGSYTVTASTNLGCDNTMSYEVVVSEQPIGLIAEFLDTELCEGENAMLDIAGFTGEGVVYEFTGPNAPAATDQTNVNFGSFDFGSYNYSVVAIAEGCVSAPIELGFEVQSVPTSSIVKTGEEECVEPGSQITLQSTVPLANYEWTFNGQVISENSFINIENVNAEDSGLYQLEISGSFGCTSTVTEILSITEAVSPVEIALSNGACIGEVIQLQAIDDNTDLSYRWTLNGEIFSTEQNPTIDFLSESNTGDYIVLAINPQTGCSATSETESLVLLSKPTPEQDFGLIFLPTPNIEMTLTDNDNIPEGTDYTISIFQEPEFGRVEILDATKGKINYIRETEMARTDRFFYELCYDDCDEACERIMATINIKYSTDECVTTNLISPNGDGTNDEFIIYCLEDADFVDNVLTIYNQWGDKVYTAAPYKNDWTGTFEGEDLPDGTYFYTFRRDAQTEVKKGHLTIFR